MANQFDETLSPEISLGLGHCPVLIEVKLVVATNEGAGQYS